MRKIAGLLLIITFTFACGTGSTPAPATTTLAQEIVREGKEKV